MILPEIDAPIGWYIYRGLLDFTFMFGLDMIVIGVYMIYASRDPARHFSIVWLVVSLEIVRGVFDDIYMILQGYAAPFYIGLIIVPPCFCVGRSIFDEPNLDASEGRFMAGRF